MVVIIKQYKPEFAVYVSIIAGILILFLAIDKMTGIINLLQSISEKTYINKNFLGILLKITGIAILTELLISDDDSGESFREALNQIERFKVEIKSRYREYLKQKELEFMSKQLKALQKEATMRLYELNTFYEKRSKGK